MTGGLILVTRPQPGADATAGRLAQRGLHAILAPMLTVRRVAADLPAPAPQAVLVTSANALPGLPPCYCRLPLLTVGAATAAAAQAAGFTRVASADGNAADLLALATARCDPGAGPLLLASGDGQGGDLAAALRQRGFEVRHSIVYAADPAPALPDGLAAAWNSHAIAAALFFSAETARALVRLIGQAGMTDGARWIEAIAIAPPAAEALAPLPWRRVRVAVTPDQDAMLALLT